MKQDCDICRGYGTIRLPVHQRISAFAQLDNSSPITRPMHRDFPCPECAGTTTDDRVRVFEAHAQVDERYVNEARLSARRDAVFSLAENMINEGLVTFTEARDSREMAVRITAVVGVVSKRFVASIEQRAKVRQLEVASRVVSAARAKILNWGSQYTGAEGGITKGQAVRYVSDALREVEMEEESKAKAA